MKRITIFTMLLPAVVMCGLMFSGCYTYLAAGQGDDRDDPWVERWSGWYTQDLDGNYGPEYPKPVIVNRYWYSTDMRAFHRNVYDWTRGCWVLEPEFRVSIGWTDGWFDWDFGWDWTWGRAYRPVFWHPPVWALRMWNPPMAYFGWWPHHEWTRPYWGEWRHGHAYAFDRYDRGYRHSGWMNRQAYYPDQPRMQERRSFATCRGADSRKSDRFGTASRNSSPGGDSRRSGFWNWSGEESGSRQTHVSDRAIESSRGTGRQAVRRENRTIEPVPRTQTRITGRKSSFPNRGFRGSNPEYRTPGTDLRREPDPESRSSRRTVRVEARTSNSEFRNPNPEFGSTTPDARSSRRIERPGTRRLPNIESRTSNPGSRFPSREFRPSNPEPRTPDTEFRNPNAESRLPDRESGFKNREFRIPSTDHQRKSNTGFGSTTPEPRPSRRIERTETRQPMNNEFRAPKNESRFQSREFRTSNPEPRKANSEFRAPNPEPRQSNPESRSSNPQRRRR